MDSISDVFIRQLIQQHTPVEVFLVSGIKLSGYIDDADTVSLRMSGRTIQLVYKQAISTICKQATHSTR